MSDLWKIDFAGEREQEFVGWAQGSLSFDQRAAREFSEYARPVLAERRRGPRDDVISELIRSEVDGLRRTCRG